MDDYTDVDTEEFMRECASDDAEINALNAKMDNASEWIELLEDILSATGRFNDNMDSLSQAIESQKEQAEKASFLFGTLLAGIISAYEGFTHELFTACCNKSDYISKALLNIDKLEPKESRHLRLARKKISTGELREKLLKATLHDPRQIADIARILFGLHIPVIKKDLSDKLLEIRNAYAHNNGYSNGKYIALHYQDAREVHHLFIHLVNSYVSRIVNESDKALASA